MENRLEQMGKIATTADVLEAQQKEQKVVKREKLFFFYCFYSLHSTTHN